MDLGTRSAHFLGFKMRCQALSYFRDLHKRRCNLFKSTNRITAQQATIELPLNTTHGCDAYRKMGYMCKWEWNWRNIHIASAYQGAKIQIREDSPVQAKLIHYSSY